MPTDAPPWAELVERVEAIRPTTTLNLHVVKSGFKHKMGLAELTHNALWGWESRKPQLETLDEDKFVAEDIAHALCRDRAAEWLAKEHGVFLEPDDGDFIIWDQDYQEYGMFRLGRADSYDLALRMAVDTLSKERGDG